MSSSSETRLESRALIPVVSNNESSEIHDETETLSSKCEKDRQEYKREVDPLSFPMTIRKMTQTVESLFESNDPSMIGFRLGDNAWRDTAKATSNHYHKWSHQYMEGKKNRRRPPRNTLSKLSKKSAITSIHSACQV